MTHELLKFLLALTLASSAALLTVLSLRRAARLLSASSAYLLWLLVPVSLAAALLPHARLTGAAAAQTMQAGSVSAVSHALNLSVAVVARASSIEGPAWLLVTWLAGAVLMASYLVIVQQVFVAGLGVLSRSRSVYRAASSSGCPVVIGLLRPKIVLPADFATRYNRRERRLILSHERTHLRRGDAAWNALAAAMRCVFWFNPLVHVGYHCFRLDQELACDAAVMQEYAHMRRAYAHAMLKTQGVAAAVPFGSLWRSGQQVKTRLRMLKRNAPSPIRRASGFLSVALVSLIAGYAVWAAEPAGTINVDADHVDADNPSKTADFTSEEGRQVVMTQGTMKVTADRAHGTGISTGAAQPSFEDGRWTFTGNVHIYADPRGTLRSDQAIVDVRNQRMSVATAIGKPAEFEQHRGSTGELTRGHADLIVYDVEAGTVKLTNDAWLDTGRSQLTGPLVVYNMRQQRALADSGKDATKPGVHVTIVPNSTVAPGMGTGAAPGSRTSEPVRKP